MPIYFLVTWLLILRLRPCLSELSSPFLPRQPTSLSRPERLAHLVAGYRYLEDLYQHGIEVTDIEKDYSTQDIFIGFKTAIEKKIWI